MYEAEGFAFETEEDAANARNEAEGIRYIKEQTKMDDPDTILKLYHSILSKNLFKTEVGMRFLMELQEYLKAIPYIKDSDIQPIPVRSNSASVSHVAAKKSKPAKAKKTQVAEKPAKAVSVKYKRGFAISLFFAIVFGISVIAMFVIVASTDTSKMINYENEIIDHYEGWEGKLREKEKELNEREEQLEEKEELLNKKEEKLNKKVQGEPSNETGSEPEGTDNTGNSEDAEGAADSEGA